MQQCLINSVKYHNHLDPIPDELSDRQFWQYGVGDHSIYIQSISGSILVNLYASDNVILKVVHSVLLGSSQSVFGRNIKSRRNIIQLDNERIIVPEPDNMRIILPVLDHGMHIYFPLSLFICFSKPKMVQELSVMAV